MFTGFCLTPFDPSEYGRPSSDLTGAALLAAECLAAGITLSTYYYRRNVNRLSHADALAKPRGRGRRPASFVGVDRDEVLLLRSAGVKLEGIAIVLGCSRHDVRVALGLVASRARRAG